MKANKLVAIGVSIFLVSQPMSVVAAADEVDVVTTVEAVSEVVGTTDVEFGGTTGSSFTAVTEAGEVVAPPTAAGNLVLGDLAVALPGEQSSRGIESDRTIVYPQIHEDTDLAVNVTDAGFQMFAVLNSENADTTVEFGMDVSGANQTIQLADDGSAVISATYHDPASGTDLSVEIASIDKPWAVDAEGNSIDTEYSVVGSTLVQTINTDATTEYPVVADPKVHFSCGYVTCTIRFNRSATRDIRDGSGIAGGASTMTAAICGALSAGTCVVVAGVIAGYLWTQQTFAGRYYENGNCYGVKFNLYPPPPATASWPTQVKRGTYNCS